MNTRLVKRCELQVFNLDRNPVLWRRLGGVTSLNLKKLRWQLPVLAVTSAEKSDWPPSRGEKVA